MTLFTSYATFIKMAANKARETGERTRRHRKAHKLVQAWVSLGLHKALKVRAKDEGRTLANFVRRELAKLVGITGVDR